MKKNVLFIILTFLTVGIFFANANTQTFVNPITEAFLDVTNAPSINDVMYWDGSKMAWTASSTWDTNTTYTGGTNLTLDGTTFNVDDAFIKNDGDIGSGNFDFGGATFFEIPNGTDGTADDPGEIYHDTSDNQLILDNYVVAKATHKIWSVTVASTSQAFISGGLLKVPTELDGYTMTAIRCSVQSGTSKVIAVEDASANSTEDITCTDAVASDDGSITNAAATAAEEMFIDFGATTGAVDYVSITVFGTWTRD